MTNRNNSVIIEKRTLSVYDLRNLCIARNWYTRGDCFEFDKMLAQTNEAYLKGENVTTKKLATIAKNIVEHSVLPADYDICCVMYELAKVCEVTFEMK